MNISLLCIMLSWGSAALRPVVPAVGSAPPLAQAEWQLEVARPEGGVVLMLILFVKIPLSGSYKAITTKRCQRSSGTRLTCGCAGAHPWREQFKVADLGVSSLSKGWKKIADAVHVNFTS